MRPSVFPIVTIIIWDKGTYEPEEDITPEGQLNHGELKFELQGKKLRGAFALVRMGGRPGKPKEKSRWLLIKRKEEWGGSGVEGGCTPA